MNKVLFWPGRGQNLGILSSFQRCLEAHNVEIEYVSFKYDEGQLNPQNWSQVCGNDAEWWIGLSLGASLACYSLPFAARKPKRLTLINPFSSRELLSLEKQFSLAGQWKFALNGIRENVDLDIVRSVFDDKIPLHHSFDIVKNNRFRNVSMIFVNGNHTIDERLAQEELADVLTGETNGESDYCYVCDRRRAA